MRAVDYDIAPGVYPDMKERGWDKDDWPEIYKKVQRSDILVLGTPIWLGEKSSVCTKIIERLYGMSGLLNEQGPYAFYGKVGGCLITGNEDALVPLYSVRQLSAGMVIAPIHIIENSGHMVILEQPEPVRQHLKNFLDHKLPIW